MSYTSKWTPHASQCRYCGAPALKFRRWSPAPGADEDICFSCDACRQVWWIEAAASPEDARMKIAVKPYAMRLSGTVAQQPYSMSWTIPALCAAYDWPDDAPGGGMIAIIELGGGWKQSDVEQAFAAMKLPAPSITDVSVDGTTNSPGADADGEVALDIQVAAASYTVATGGKPATLRIYWCQDIAAGVAAAQADGCDVCSISWGLDEALWGKVDGYAMDAAATAATNAGMVICAAAGDNDSSDGGTTPANVDLPGSARRVISCGGTSRWPSGTEVVWNNENGKSNGSGTGGGYSTLFAMQVWQTGAPRPPPSLGRMVPDVAACADPNTGYQIVLDGQVEVVGGTSAVAPLFAGLFAACGRKLGFIAPKLYENKTAFRDIMHGNNGLYHAGLGPDPCSGIGSPNGKAIVALFV
jgi:kumamolisin